MREVKDPYGAFRFVVEINGSEVGGFSQVTGLERETTFEEFREGGVNDYVHKLVTVSKYPNLTLRRGITDAEELWRWHQDVIDGSVERKTISVVLKDAVGVEKWRWIALDAYPAKWSGSDLDAAGNAVVVESVEFAHHGLRKE